MMELALLESSLADAQKTEEKKEKEKGLTAEEEQNLDSIMQSLDIESGDEGNVENIDLDALGESMSEVDEGEDIETRDFNAEFGL